jgi:hypothetical protein
VTAHGPFTFPMEPGASTEMEAEELSKTRATLPLLPLEIVYDANLAQALRGSTVALALQGSRHFREPSSASGVIGYEGCSIVILRKTEDELERTVGRVPGWEDGKKNFIGSARTLMIQGESEDTGQPYFAAFPMPNVLLVANEREYLLDVLERINRRRIPRALPDELPEWRLFNREAKVWGLRHYDLTQASKDPTSPLGPHSTYVQSDPSAIGILFMLDPKNERSLLIESFSHDKAKVKAEASKRTVECEAEYGVKYEVKLRSPTAGVVEQIYTLDQSGPLDWVVLDILVALGRVMTF